MPLPEYLAHTVNADAAVEFLAAMDDQTAATVLRDTLEKFSRSLEDDNTLVSQLDLGFVCRVLATLFQNVEFLDVVRGNYRGKRWFDDDDESPRPFVAPLGAIEEEYFGFYRTTAYHYAVSLTDQVVSHVLQYVLTRALFAQVESGDCPRPKLDFLAMVKALDCILSGGTTLFREWQRHAESKLGVNE